MLLLMLFVAPFTGVLRPFFCHYVRLLIFAATSFSNIFLVSEASRIQLTKLVVLSWALGIPADGIVIAAALSTQVRSVVAHDLFGSGIKQL